MAVDVRVLAGARPTGSRRQQVVSGIVSTEQSAPAAIGDPVYVVIPSHSSELSSPLTWEPLWGVSLPAQGADVLVAYDENNAPYVVWWDGEYTAPTVTEINGTTVPLTGSAWIAPTLINSWANAGAPDETAAYLKDPLGFVHIKGVVSGGASGTVAFVLPAGYRPGATGKYGNTNTSLAVTTANVDASGNVTIYWSGSGSTIGLSGINFLAEN